MKIKELKKRSSNGQNEKAINAYNQFDKLITELKEKELPDEIIISVNNELYSTPQILDSCLNV